MKLKLAAAILLASIAGGYAQCVKCNSFKEAEAEPLKVKSLIINPYIDNTEDDQLEEVPASLKTFTNLEILFLTDLSLGEIPASIASLRNLKELSLAGTHLLSCLKKYIR